MLRLMPGLTSYILNILSHGLRTLINIINSCTMNDAVIPHGTLYHHQHLTQNIYFSYYYKLHRKEQKYCVFHPQSTGRSPPIGFPLQRVRAT